MNINMLRDSDNDAGFYAAACGRSPASWSGAIVYVSCDDGASYSSLAHITSASTMGQANNVLGDFGSGNIPDEINFVNVTLFSGSLASTTNEGLLAGVNTCIVGDEILFFRDAMLQANGSYTLRGLLRGQRGSEYAMSQHADLDRFVLFNASSTVRVPQANADIGMTRLYKPVSLGSTLAAATAQEFANQGMGLRPYACVHLGGGRNADDDVVLTWTRRNRIDGSWRDSVDVPNSEASEAYEVEIYSDSTYSTVWRTITGLSAPTTLYTAAQQVTDAGSPQATVYFKVYQLSAVVGRGHAASGSV